jgi:hypothetical protein
MRNPPPAMIRLTYLIETEGRSGEAGGEDRQRPVDRHLRGPPGETEELKARVAARVVDVRPLPPVADLFLSVKSPRGPSTAPRPTSTFPSTPSAPILRR